MNSFPAQQSASPAQPPARPTVLVVDDELLVRSTAAKMVTYFGYDSLVAATGHEALEILHSTPQIDLILLDLTMPGMDGFTTFSAIRQMRPDQRIVIFSGYRMQDAQHRFSGEKFPPFLQKPFTADSLRKILQENCGAT